MFNTILKYIAMLILFTTVVLLSFTFFHTVVEVVGGWFLVIYLAAFGSILWASHEISKEPSDYE